MRAAKNCLAKTFYHMVLIKSSLVLFLAFIPACFIFSFTAFGLFWWKIANQYVGFVMFSFSMHGESLIFFIFLIILDSVSCIRRSGYEASSKRYASIVASFDSASQNWNTYTLCLQSDRSTFLITDSFLSSNIVGKSMGFFFFTSTLHLFLYFLIRVFPLKL